MATVKKADSKADSLVEKLSNPETVGALTRLVDRVTELHETGVLDSFFETVQAITFAKDAMTDTMVGKNASMMAGLMEIASEAAGPEILDSVRELKEIHRSGKLRDLFEVTDSISFLLNSATERMLEKNAKVIGELYSMGAELADPDMIEAVRELKNLQKSGNLKALAEASSMIAFLANVMTDTMVQRIAVFGSSFVEHISATDINVLLKSATKCISDTVSQFSQHPPKPGLKSLLAAMRDPDVQKGLLFMTNLAKNLQLCLTEAYSATGQTAG